MGLPSYREIIELVKKGATVEAQEQIMELRESALALQEENFQLKERVRELENERITGSDLVRVGNRYFRRGDDKEEHPYCLTCWDADRKLVSLIVGSNSYGLTIKCNICAARAKT